MWHTYLSAQCVPILRGFRIQSKKKKIEKEELGNKVKSKDDKFTLGYTEFESCGAFKHKRTLLELRRATKYRSVAANHVGVIVETAGAEGTFGDRVELEELRTELCGTSETLSQKHVEKTEQSLREDSWVGAAPEGRGGRASKSGSNQWYP